MPDKDLKSFMEAAFMMLNQPLVVVKYGRISYMNSEAVLLAGDDLTGKPASGFIPFNILNTSASHFISTASIASKSCIVKANVHNGFKIYVIYYPKQDFQSDEMLFETLASTLTNIKFASSCIAEIAAKQLNSTLLEYACTLDRSYFRIKHTLSNIAFLRDFQDGKVFFNPEIIDMTELCRTLIRDLRRLHSERDLVFSLNAEDNLKIVADRELCTRLLLNLISNSILHCSKTGRISISLLRTENELMLGVDDNGSGISLDQLPHIMDRYRYGINTVEQGGAGMGLAVVRGIAELHRGSVLIESRGLDMGTAVRVMLSTEIELAPRFQTQTEEGPCDNSRLITTELSYVLPSQFYRNRIDSED